MQRNYDDSLWRDDSMVKIKKYVEPFMSMGFSYWNIDKFEKNV